MLFSLCDDLSLDTIRLKSKLYPNRPAYSIYGYDMLKERNILESWVKLTMEESEGRE
jgi:hypothetical protein